MAAQRFARTPLGVRAVRSDASQDLSFSRVGEHQPVRSIGEAQRAPFAAPLTSPRSGPGLDRDVLYDGGRRGERECPATLICGVEVGLIEDLEQRRIFRIASLANAP